MTTILCPEWSMSGCEWFSSGYVLVVSRPMLTAVNDVIFCYFALAVQGVWIFCWCSECATQLVWQSTWNTQLEITNVVFWTEYTFAHTCASVGASCFGDMANHKFAKKLQQMKNRTVFAFPGSVCTIWWKRNVTQLTEIRAFLSWGACEYVHI